MCTLSFSLLLKTPRGEAKIQNRNILGLRISESVDGPRQTLDQRTRATAVGLRVTSSRLVSPARCCWDAFGLPPICRLLYDYNAVAVEGDGAS